MAKSVLKQLKENEREMRRTLIIQAAKNLFKTTTFYNIGMRTIANKAGISVASLYQYFPCQDDLFVEILKTDLHIVKKHLWIKKTSLEEMSIDIANFFLDNDDIFQIMSHFMIRGEKHPEALEKFNTIQEIFLKSLEATLSRTNPDSDVSKYSKAFFTALFGNIITFRNTSYTENSKNRENLFELVRITAKAFQNSADSKKNTNHTA